MAELEALGVRRVRAANASPFTLTGTNTWIVGRDPAWVIDPGPDDDAHVAAVLAAAAPRGGVGGIALTHRHPDHVGALARLRERAGWPPVAAARGAAELPLAAGGRAGPLEALPTPGHTTDHLAFAYGRVCFTGDAVLGGSSVFIAPEPGALSAYLDGLRALRRRGFRILCPGHGPVLRDAHAALDSYLAHRLERERRLIAALRRGLRQTEELLDEVWDDAPRSLRGAARVTLVAHLEKLREERRLPLGMTFSADSPWAAR